MKKLSFFILILVAANSFAQNQNEFRVGMGIDFLNTPSLSDYINQSNFSSVDDLSDFSSAVHFSAEYGRMLSSNYQVAVEVGYLIYSYTVSDVLGQYEMAYNLILPSILNYYVISGNGYNFKFGGGAGLRLLSADETLPGTGSATNYSSTGFGFILRAEGNTQLSGDLYAHIGADVRYDINGEPENNGEKLFNNVANENVNFNTLSFGVKLGVSYYF